MDVGIASMPVIDETGKPIAPYMGVQGVQVLKNAAENKKDAVEQVLRVLMKDEVGIALAQASGCAPARENCYSYEEVNGDEVVMAMKETAENAVPMPNLPEMDVMWHSLDIYRLGFSHSLDFFEHFGKRHIVLHCVDGDVAERHHLVAGISRSAFLGGDILNYEHIFTLAYKVVKSGLSCD